MGHLCHFAFTRLVTNKQTDGTMNGQVENIVPPANLYWRRRRHKKKTDKHK